MKTKIELCRTLSLVIGFPMSPPLHDRGPSHDIPLLQPPEMKFHASYHMQNTRPYQNVSEVRFTGCIVCGSSVDAITKEKVEWYISQSTPRNEPQYITRLKREAYENGLNADSFLFVAAAVSQAVACDGTSKTTTAEDRKVCPESCRPSKT